MIFCSFYTPSGNYPFLASKLQRSLNRFGLAHDIQAVSLDFKSWVKGTHFKSKFILGMLLKHRKTVVWLDIDTEVWQYPKLLFGNHDFAIYNWLADKNHHLSGKIEYSENPKKLFCSGGVQKWSYTAASMHLLLAWIDAIQRRSEDLGDDLFLDKAFNESNLNIDCLWLPKAYNRMDKHTHHWANIPPSEVIINHDYTAGRHGNA